MDDVALMGVINVYSSDIIREPTREQFLGPFYDWDKTFQPESIEAVRHVSQGASMLDVGCESTRPYSHSVSMSEELKRIDRAIRGITSWHTDYYHEKHSFGYEYPSIDLFAHYSEGGKLSVDTWKSQVAVRALSKGFSIVNDVTALRGDPAMVDVVLALEPEIILVYAKDDTPRTTRKNMRYKDVITTLKDFFQERMDVLTSQGFSREKILIDPGLGCFVSSDPVYSLEIIERLNELKALGQRIVVGASRKLRPPKGMAIDEYSAQLSLKAHLNGANVIRTHNVGLTKVTIENHKQKEKIS